jgi:histidyl-tRNA synthetase
VARRIEPRTLKGFTDELPARAYTKEWCIQTAKATFRSFGYLPIETPALEYADILMGKLAEGAELERQIYRFEDQGGRDVALRFDLTVPLARFVAQHRNELQLPFKRYQVGTVWRGENPQAGRLREFTQCDIDIVGTTSPAADGEVLAVIGALMQALHMPAFDIHVNDRALLAAVLEEGRVTADAAAVLRAIDKLPKIGRDGVEAELLGLSLSVQQAADVLDLCTASGAADDVLARFGTAGDRLREVIDLAVANGLPADAIVVDLSIARGLDYYTGTVFESFLRDLRGIGSICSGGRYDGLTALYSSDALGGVGASLGLSRVLDAWERLDTVPAAPSAAAVVVLRFKGVDAPPEALANQLRAAGIAAETYPDARKIGDQFKYAERKGCRVAVIRGPGEFEAGTVKVKDLATRAEHEVTVDALASTVRDLLAEPHS